MKVLEGKSVFSGIAIGKISILQKVDTSVKRVHVEDPEEEVKRVEAAKEQAVAQLQKLYDKALQEVGESGAAIFEVHQMMLDDDDYLDSIHNIIRTESVNAEYAVATTGDNFSSMFAQMDDDYMKARAADVKDISDRLVRVLSGHGDGELEASEPVIVVAEDLAPSETVQLDKSKVLSFVTRHGSTNSHTAILARTMNIPALIGVDFPEDVDGKMGIVDGYEGKIIIDPPVSVMEAYQKKKAEDEEKKRLLIISGPNAGGKSVCLKTVGLLQYMLQCGLLIPVYESSKTGLFENLFIDIGDEQSIENDLSTYSSHLTNMKFFVKNCNSKTLILIDEFGSGTEPQIGGAIAEALLDRFNRNHSYGVITTHYQNLKHFAEDTEGIVNGAMLYDRHLMQPLFKLSIGNPGSSFAVEIARKIGLPEDVIADASANVGSDYINMDKYLQDIVRDKRYWESKRQNIRQQEKKLEDITARYEQDLEAVNKQRKEIMRNAKEEAQRILSEANAKIENTIREIKEAQAEKEQTKLARKALEEFKASVIAAEEEDDKIARKMAKLQERKERKKQKQNAPASKQVFNRDVIEAGDNVRLKGQVSAGTVMEVQGKQAVVAFGMIKSTVKLEQLEKVSKGQIKKEIQKSTFVSVQTADDMHEKKLNFKQEIDVRGMRGDEALQAVTYFVDDAIQVGAARIRILHGTGTGILRQLIRDYLHTVPGVRQYHDEHVQFGGAGITVVELE